MAADDPDFHIRDLHDAIERGDHPSWTLEVQIMPFEDAADYRFNPFDLTKVWPHGDYPPIKIGRLVLDRNPENYFAEVEQAAFEPANMVPGIGPSPDKMLLGRVFSYPDTHRYRIGPNYNQLPINQPRVPVHSYNKDGAMRYRHDGSRVHYAPNSFDGPVADPARFGDPGFTVTGEIVRSAYTLRRDDDDFGQPGTLYRYVMSQSDRDHLASNVVEHLRGVSSGMAERAIAYWRSVDPDIADRVAAGLGRETAQPMPAGVA